MRIDKPCPKCGNYPDLEIWKLRIPNAMCYLLYLKCEDGMHIFQTSPSEDIQKVEIDWYRLINQENLKQKENKMNWIKAMSYMKIGFGFFARLIQALADGILTGQEVLTNLITTFNDAFGDQVADDTNIVVDEDETWFMIKLKKDLLNDVKLDLTK